MDVRGALVRGEQGQLELLVLEDESLLPPTLGLCLALFDEDLPVLGP